MMDRTDSYGIPIHPFQRTEFLVKLGFYACDLLVIDVSKQVLSLGLKIRLTSTEDGTGLGGVKQVS